MPTVKCPSCLQMVPEEKLAAHQANNCRELPAAPPLFSPEVLKDLNAPKGSEFKPTSAASSGDDRPRMKSHNNDVGDQQEEPPLTTLEQSDLLSRLLGLAMVGFGTLLTYMCIIKPYLDAKAMSDSVSISLKGCLFAPFGLVYGPFFLFMGKDFKKILGTKAQPKAASIVLGVVAVALGVLSYFVVKQQLNEMGYKF